MLTIIDLEAFNSVLSDNSKIICFVHTPWSGPSIVGLKNFTEIAKLINSYCFIVVINNDDDSFIHNWLEE